MSRTLSRRLDWRSSPTWTFLLFVWSYVFDSLVATYAQYSNVLSNEFFVLYFSNPSSFYDAATVCIVVIHLLFSFWRICGVDHFPSASAAIWSWFLHPSILVTVHPIACNYISWGFCSFRAVTISQLLLPCLIPSMCLDNSDLVALHADFQLMLGAHCWYPPSLLCCCFSVRTNSCSWL